MTPDQIGLLLRAGALVGLVAAGAAGGWAVNGWRLGTKVEHLQGDKDALRTQVELLATSTQACSKAVEVASQASAQSLKQGEDLLADAKRRYAGTPAALAKLEKFLDKPTPSGAGCEQAWAEIEKARAAR